jgi:hypothetical protein
MDEVQRAAKMARGMVWAALKLLVLVPIAVMFGAAALGSVNGALAAVGFAVAAGALTMRLRGQKRTTQPLPQPQPQIWYDYAYHSWVTITERERWYRWDGATWRPFRWPPCAAGTPR